MYENIHNHYPHTLEPLDMSGMENSVGALTVEAAPEHAMKHGACKINESVSNPTKTTTVLVGYCPITAYLNAGRDSWYISHGSKGRGQMD